MTKFTFPSSILLGGLGVVAASPALYFAYKFRCRKEYLNTILKKVDTHDLSLVQKEQPGEPFLIKKTHVFQTTESLHSGLGIVSEVKSVVDKEGVTEYTCNYGCMIQNPYVHVDWNVTYNTSFNPDNDTYTVIKEAYHTDNSKDVYVIKQQLGERQFIHAIIQNDHPNEYLNKQIKMATKAQNISMASAALVVSIVLQQLLCI